VNKEQTMKGWRRFLVGLLVVGLLGLPSARSGAARGVAVYTLRLASIAPKGSLWGNAMETMGREVEMATRGRVRVKVYLGGAAGDELQVAERIKKGQLDGTISGGWLCNEVMPSTRAIGLIGVFQTRDEANHVTYEMRPELEKEAARAGFTLLGTAALGTIIVFSRDPITSMADLRKAKLWRWEGELAAIKMANAMGFSAVPGKLEAARKMYDSGAVDGFFAIPMAALAFQWFAQARYITELPTGYLFGCYLVSNSWLDKLPPELRAAVGEASARMAVVIHEAGNRQDAALMGKIFAKQGLKKVPVSERFRAEFFEAARSSREKVSGEFVPPSTLDRVMRLLADYRSEHR
jgi:TRAP-type C4-dicarboxylate transport system substrate-binding protein